MAPIAMVLGCASPLPVLPMEMDASTSEGTGTTTEPSSETAPSSSSQDGTTGTGSGSSSDEGLDSSGDADGGFCAMVCEELADCVPAMGNEADWVCTDGFCEFIGESQPCDPTSCDDLGVGLACADVGGMSQCTIPCDDDSMCVAGVTTCSGTDDAGNSICAPPPCGGAAEGEPCTFGGTTQYGVCTAGVCTCTDDAECTAPGQGCNN